MNVYVYVCVCVGIEHRSAGQEDQTVYRDMMTSLGMFHEAQARMAMRLTERSCPARYHAAVWEGRAACANLRTGRDFRFSYVCNYRWIEVIRQGVSGTLCNVNIKVFWGSLEVCRWREKGTLNLMKWSWELIT